CGAPARAEVACCPPNLLKCIYVHYTRRPGLPRLRGANTDCSATARKPQRIAPSEEDGWHSIRREWPWRKGLRSAPCAAIDDDDPKMPSAPASAADRAH